MKTTKQQAAPAAPSREAQTKHLNVKIPSDTLTRLKIFAVKNQKTIGEALQDIIHKGVTI
ncbi:MAG: hypothetical protein KBA61_03435 [Spirochaetes bacterium]|nr:hypothetical protein [Spirochaetota bacterium]